MINFTVSCTPQDVKREKEEWKKRYNKELTGSKEDICLLFETLVFERHYPALAAEIYSQNLKKFL